MVEVKIKRPDTKYQLGFSVQNGVVRTNVDLIDICICICICFCICICICIYRCWSTRTQKLIFFVSHFTPLSHFPQICSLLRGGIAERGGVRVGLHIIIIVVVVIIHDDDDDVDNDHHQVGHRIIEINGQSVVAVPHERIVNLLATSVGEVRLFSLFFANGVVVVVVVCKPPWEVRFFFLLLMLLFDQIFNSRRG